MGFCENGTVMDLIKNQKGQRIGILKIISYFRQLMDAMKHCHEKKLIHRDIKVSQKLTCLDKCNFVQPDNLLLTKNGKELQLGDFGLSQVQAFTANSMRTVDPNGFPAYLAPELLKLPELDSKGEYVLKYDHKVDIWSCGAILYELFHLAMMWFKWPPQPIPGALVTHLTRQRVQANQHEPFASDCPAAIKRLVLKCCDQSAARRPEASELLEQATEMMELIEAGQKMRDTK